MTLPLFDAHDDPDRRLFDDGSFAQIRRGWYVEREALDTLPRYERYRLEVRAVAAARPSAVFARESALALAGLPSGDPKDVYTIGSTSTSGFAAGVRNSHAAIGDDDVIVVDGIARCSPAYALADIARRGRQVDAVAALDWALRVGAVELGAVADALTRQGPRGRRRAEWVLGFADPLAESVGESWSRVVMHRMGAPVPELQATVPTSIGDKFPDFRWWRSGMRPLAGESDGAWKYGVLAEANGIQPVDAVIAEKRREDAIRETHDMVRWMWDAVLHPQRLVAKLARAGLPVRTTLLPGW